MPTLAELQGHFKRKCNQWLHDTMLQTKKRLYKAQDRYKTNLDKRFRKQNEAIQKDDELFLRDERKT